MSSNKKTHRTPGSEQLTSRPFKNELQNVKPAPVGPVCLSCGESIDTRLGWCFKNTRGSRKIQRHGWMHDECEQKATVELAKKQNTVGTKTVDTLRGPVQVQFAQQGTRLEVPTFSEQEMDFMLNGSGKNSTES